jgi:hypothetical protein
LTGFVSYSFAKVFPFIAEGNPLYSGIMIDIILGVGIYATLIEG